MTSMTLFNSNQPENLMGSTTCYMVSTAASSNSTPLTYSSSSSTTSHSPPNLVGTQRIAPKMPNQQQHKYLNHESTELMRCKRRIQLGHLASSGKSMSPQPAAVARRNERERNRVRLVNLGFATLRQHVPSTTKNKKMSKVDTLKSAVEYIKRLQELLGETGVPQGGSMDENSYPMGGQSSTGSPTPSLCSDASSPYEVMHGDEDDELMDFASWF
ncbi:achaete-scute homolog 1 [Trichonephila clavata]|uniref:Achaete-scute homolog 1 n=1 Tax=Trichonephila clavata TaxID=2740835 RepID=A0A8X6KW52_TRICU|nr:achaete-scute homolog 1 [Trichonephila clavata]